MRTGITVHLNPTDPKRLQVIVDDRNSPQKHVWRARIVLATADGLGTAAIMRTAGVSKTAAWRWQARFMEEGVPGLLHDKTRPARVDKLANEVAERIVALTLQRTYPNGGMGDWGVTMYIESGLARTAAGLIALIAWVGLLVQLIAVTAQVGSATEAVWVILRYFTVVTNLLAAVVLTGLALGQSAFQSQRLLGLLALSILFVGAVYVVLLRGLVELSGGALIADIIMHYVVPSLTSLFWLLFAPKGALRWRDPLLWAIYPLVYFAYALTRGASDGKYPYPFMDIPKVGWLSALTTVAIILALYLLVGLILVWLGRWLDNPKGKPISTRSPR